jgi:hypothetical protein
MNQLTEDALTVDPALDLAAMATIVRDLLAAGATRRQDSLWLRNRAVAADLDPNACDALEAMRLKLIGAGSSILDAATILSWD